MCVCVCVAHQVLKLLGDAYERASVAGGAAVGPGSAGNTGHTTGAPTTAARNALLHILGSVQGSSSSSCAQRGPTHGPQQQHSTAQHSDGRTGETRSTASGGSSGGAAASGASGGGKPHSPVLASMRRATSAALAALGQAFNTTANSAVNSAATDVSGAQSGSGKPEQLSLGQRYVTMKTSKSAANLSELSGMASDTQVRVFSAYQSYMRLTFMFSCFCATTGASNACAMHTLGHLSQCKSVHL